MGTLTSRMSKALHIGHHRHPQSDNGHGGVSRPGAESSSSSSSDSSSDASRPVTPMLDPSTNTNPLEHPDEMNNERGGGTDEKKKKRKRTGDVSKHTFYIENSQMRLKLFAHNEVSFPSTPQYSNSANGMFSGKCYNGSLRLRKLLLAHIILVTIDLRALRPFV